MSNPLPLLIAGGAALLFLSGGKKRERSAKTLESKNDEDADKAVETEIVQAEIPKLGVDKFGPVERGVRKDRRGHHPWRIYLDDSGYHAQIMLDSSRYSPVQEEIGISATSGAAKAMLRDHFNKLLLKIYPNEKPKNDPAAKLSITATKITRP